MRLTLAVAPLLTLALAGPALAQAAGGRPLVSGEAVSSSLPRGGKIYETYLVEVPVGATRLTVRAEGTGDVDIYMRAGSPIVSSWTEEATVLSNSSAHAEELTLTPTSTPPLRATTYYLDVVNGTEEAFKYTLLAQVETGSGPGAVPLVEEEPVPKREGSYERVSDDAEKEFQLASDGVNFRTFVVEVAADVSSVQLRLTGAKHDVDLYVRYGETMTDWEQADHKANTASPDETLSLSRTAGAPRLRTGVYYVDVARATDEETHVTLTARFERGYTGPEAPAGSLTGSSEAGVEGEVTQDTIFSASLNEDPTYRTYIIVVPKEAGSLLVTVAGAERDVDLYLRHGASIEDYANDPDHRANGSRKDEQLYVDRSSDPPLRPGRYYLDVTRAGEEGAGDVEVSVRFDAERPPPLPATSGPVVPLTLGRRLDVRLERSVHKAGRYSIRVPAGSRSLHITALRATRDVDLFLRHEGPITSYDEASGYDHKAVTPQLSERLVINAQSDPPLRPGEWFLDVASLVSSDEHIGFTLVVTVDAPPDYTAADLPLPPYAKGESTPLERAVRATVQIASSAGEGSGTCLTPSGLIVTNYHVLADEGELVREGIYVSFVDRVDQPPRQCFKAELVDASEELDLALIRVVKDVLDRPLPSPLRLPWLALGEPQSLRLGETVLVAGYPAVGGPEGRTSLTVTRGIVSGFTANAEGKRAWLKTDARINAGNSGGTALGPDFRLVGVPTHEQVSGDDELGYCRSVDTIPPEWLAKVRKALPQ
jgi:S1-C subfamily serine protease